MCAGDDKNCPDFELHHRSFKETLDRERRSFLKSGFAAAGGVAAMTAGGISLVTPQMAEAAEKNQPAKRSYHHLPANAETVHWGYFSKKLQAAGRGRVGRLRHDRSVDSPRQRRRRAHGQRRSRRRERVHWDQDEEGREPPRRGADGCLAVRAWRRRGPRRAHLHRPGRRAAAPSQATCSRCASSTSRPRPCANPQYRGQDVRQQRRGLVGLSLQGPDRRAQAARGDHDLRGRRDRRTQLGEGALQFPLDAADRSLRRGAQDHRLSRRAGRSRARSRRTGAS